MKQLRIQVEDELYDAFKDYCKSSGLSMTQIIKDYMSTVTSFAEVEFPKSIVFHGEKYDKLWETATMASYLFEGIVINIEENWEITYLNKKINKLMIVGKYDNRNKKVIEYAYEDYEYRDWKHSI